MKKKNSVAVVLEKEKKVAPAKEKGLVFKARVLGVTICKNGKEIFYPNPNLAENKKPKRKPAFNSDRRKG